MVACQATKSVFFTFTIMLLHYLLISTLGYQIESDGNEGTALERSGLLPNESGGKSSGIENKTAERPAIAVNVPDNSDTYLAWKNHLQAETAELSRETNVSYIARAIFENSSVPEETGNKSAISIGSIKGTGNNSLNIIDLSLENITNAKLSIEDVTALIYNTVEWDHPDHSKKMKMSLEDIMGLRLIFVKRSRSGDSKELKTEKSKLVDGSDNKPTYKTHLTVVGNPIGNQNRRRTKRIAGPCDLPKEMHTAALRCVLYPKHVKCIQRCAWGHTLEKGITQILSCHLKNDTWMPHLFTECKPFVDCNVHLVTPGNVTCSPATLDEGPTCNISCKQYENLQPVPERSYTCDINGHWTKPLPFCAKKSRALELIEAPRKKLHDDSEVIF